MTPHQLLALLVRLGAIWIALQGVPYLLLAGSEATQAMTYGPHVGYILGAIFVVTALALWMFPVTISHKLLPKAGSDEPLCTGSSQLTQAALLVAGVILVVVEGPDALWRISHWILMAANGSSEYEVPAGVIVSAAIGIVKALVGVLLVVRTGPIMRWLSNHRRD